MEPGNSRTVFVVQIDNTKDLSDAKQYGQLQAVFTKPRKPYDTQDLIARARRVFETWKEGDYILMIGDPTLCGVCMNVLGEFADRINVLSWDRMSFKYTSQEWDFNYNIHNGNLAED